MLSNQAERLATKVPHNELWEQGDTCGRGVLAVRLIEGLARELSELARQRTAKKGRPQSCARWLWVQAELIAEGFNFGQLAELVLLSDDDWRMPPCRNLVAHYSEPTYGERDGREQLKARLKQLKRRRSDKANIAKGRQIMFTIPVRIL